MKNKKTTKMTARLREACAFLAVLAVFVSSGFPAVRIHAAGDAAKLLITSGTTIDMQPGEKRQYRVGFKNVGTETWSRSGGNFISLYTWNPKYRTSPFVDASWRGPTQPAILTEQTVAPGGVGFLSFTLRAPGTPGTYTETYHLAVENLRWIPGGQFSVTIRVAGGAAAPVSLPPISSSAPASVPAPSSNGTLRAQKLIQSAKELAFSRGGEETRFRIMFKNAGTAGWGGYEVLAGRSGLAIAATDPSFRAASWASDRVALSTANSVAPGGAVVLDFIVRAPQKRGSYKASFHLQVDGKVVEGSDFDIPVSVTNDGPNANPVAPPPVPSSSAQPTPPSTSAGEPTLRVGVLIVDEETDWRVTLANPAGFDVVTGGAVVATIAGGASVTAAYENGAYWYDAGAGRKPSGSYLRFVPKSSNSIFTVTNFDRRVTRNAGYADNAFRDVLELHWNGSENRTWLINELPMESYLRGLAETSNISHLEFQKALITAARTYAYYHWERGTKHAAEFYHVDAYYDQVYKGYGQEQRTPRLTQSVEETRGQIVTYENRTAITPYFSRSDGRTRNWEDVWRSDPVPWLRGVSVPCDVGKELWGHGVGMSASGALCMANEGQTFDNILRYFYTGITLMKKW
ncbi:hypothetical protein EPO33_04015 [Patescibacteria group bacterium]|nr:MAG: hypothetical protein EPO33_04015 [Patescibacteria group bacterium]